MTINCFQNYQMRTYKFKSHFISFNWIERGFYSFTFRQSFFRQDMTKTIRHNRRTYIMFIFSTTSLTDYDHTYAFARVSVFVPHHSHDYQTEMTKINYTMYIIFFKNFFRYFQDVRIFQLLGERIKVNANGRLVDCALVPYCDIPD